MGDQSTRGEEFEKNAEKKLNSWSFFGSKYEDAADLFDKAANFFKLAKSWDRAGSIYVKLANCHLKLESTHEAAQAFVSAAHCYKKTSTKEAISCLQQAVNMFCDIGRLSMAARYYKDIASALDEEDVTKFTDVVKEFDSMTPLDSWKTTLLLRVKEKLKAKELEEDDLT
ncbi:hypothetical protein GOBAR_DD32903 [Gossypium barbadense]|nr:hypothetical protein GOBAR_DD32903 [Gossypium barbadense]